MGGIATVVGLIVGGSLAFYAFAFFGIENPVPLETGSGWFALIGSALAGLQIIAGVGMLNHKPWGVKLASPTSLGATIITFLLWVPVFARGMSLVGIMVATLTIVGYTIALRVLSNGDATNGTR